MTTIRRLVLISLLAMLSFTAGLFIRDYKSVISTQAVVSQDPNLDHKLTDLVRVCLQIQELYVEEKPCLKLIDVAIRGMVSDLDIHSHVYIGKGEVHKALNIPDDKSDVGVGIEIVVIGRETFITEVFENHPVASTGIKPGDVILEINGVSIRGMSFDDISGLMVGEVGTSATFKIRSRRSRRVEDYLLPRRVISVSSVAYKALDDNYAYIKIRDFSKKSAVEFHNLIANVENKAGLMIDLRNNPGGLLAPAVDIIGFFIGPGRPVITAKGRKGDGAIWKTTSIAGQFPKKIVILANRFSASAAEIMVGGLKHYGVVTLIGERTYGKGVYQNFFDVNNPNKQPDENTDLILSLTTGHYYLPDGTDVNKVGIKPDIEVRQPTDFRAYEYLTEKDTQFQAALQFLKK